MIPWFCVKLEILTVCLTCGFFTCKDQFRYLCSTPWVGILDAQMLLSSGRYWLPEGLVWRYRWPFVFLDKLLARWQRLAFGGGGSFILPFADAGLMAGFSGLNPPLVMKVVVSVGGLHPNRFRKFLWTRQICFSAVESNLDDTIWFCLMYLPYFWG